MFLCYIDESGFNGRKLNKAQPVQTMVGIFPNLYHFHKSDNEFKKVFDIIKEKIPIKEIKGSEIYRGRGSWKKKKIPPETRDKVIEYYLRWLASRNHKVIITAIDNECFFKTQEKGEYKDYFSFLQYPWLLSALHIAMVVQKLNKNLKSNKGKTLLVFDEEDTFEDELQELIFNPPEFVDEFVFFNERQEKYRLNQIIDSAYFVKSHHSSLAQVADIVAFLYKTYLELHYYEFEEAYDGEKKKIAKWIESIKDKFIPYNNIYPRKGSRFISFLNEVKAKGAKW